MKIFSIKNLVSTFSVVIVLMSLFSVPSFAVDYSYSYFQDNGVKTETSDRAVFYPEKQIDGRVADGGFNGINDIQFYNKELYILDSGHSRIVVLNNDYSLKKIIKLYDGKKSVSLNAAEGLFVYEGGIYIADTENQRMLKCDSSGKIITVLKEPDSDILPDGFSFTPVDSIVDANNYLYILLRGSYYGALLYSPDGKFIGFYGSNTVSNSVLEGLALYFEQFFETNEKLAISKQKLPYQFNDFTLDEKGYIYTVSSDSNKNSGQIRRLNSASNNILKYKDGYRYVDTDTYNFGEEQIYQDMTGLDVEQHFSGIAVENDIIYALEDSYGKIYVYDTKSNPISVFGGGMGQGTQKGIFQSPTAIAVKDGHILVSDSKKNTVTVFSKTEYGCALLDAISYSSKDDYVSAKPLWEKVLNYNISNQIANQGMAKVYIEEKNYSKALKYAKLGNDQESYAIAYEALEKEFLNGNMWWILILICLMIGVCIYCSIVIKKRNIVLVKNKKLSLAFNYLVHPFDVSGEIRHKGGGSVIISTVILALFYIVLVSNSMWTGFMYQLPNKKFSSFYSLLGSVGVLLLWVIVQWAITTLFSGKGKLSQIYIISCYSLLPVIIYKVIYLICSYIVIPSNTSMLSLIGVLAICYSAFLMAVGFITIHEYSFFKVLGVALLTVVGMMIVIFILFMMLTLGQGCISFVMNIFSEIAFR